MWRKILLTMTSMLCLIAPININAETEKPLETYIYDYETGYTDVLENNLSKMENLTKGNATTYSAEFVVDYVTPSRDYNQVVDTLNQIQELSDSICEGISSDYEKIEKIHDYVCENIAYDFIAKESFADLETISLKNVLENKRTICAGYSNFFSALCNAQGIYCINIRGAVSSSEAMLYEENAPTNHEWNAVWLDSESRWLYIDCTWDSDNTYDEDGYHYPTYNVHRTYFDIPLESISTNHKFRIIDHREFFDALNYFDITETIQTTENTTSESDTINNTVITTTTTTTKVTETITTTTTTSQDTQTSTSQTTIESISTAENTQEKKLFKPILIGLIFGFIALAIGLITIK